MSQAHPAPPSTFFRARSAKSRRVEARHHLWVVTGLGVISALGLAWLILHLVGLLLPPLGTPTVLSQIQGDLEATERNGQPVKLSQLRGKVCVMACLYTVCPHGCAAVAAEMQKLNAKHGSHPDFHLVSLSLAPERDSLDFLKAYAEAIGVKGGDPWWFVSGPQQPVWNYLCAELRMQPPKPIPKDKRLNPLDVYDHDLRLVLVDRKGRVRGHYPAFNAGAETTARMKAKLHRDVETLINHPDL